MNHRVRLTFALALMPSGLLHSGQVFSQNATEPAPVAAPGAAQVPADKPITDVTPPVPVAPAPAPAPAPVAAPAAPPAPAKKKEDAPPVVRVYGLVRAVFDVSNGVESYLNQNSSAVTAAAHPVFHLNPDARYLSFQAQQSRFGLVAGEGMAVTGKIEGDFIQFNLSSPTTASLFRLRIANIDWNVAPGHKLFIGQTWDTAFFAVGPHTINLLGSLNMSGNAGFLRHQLGYAGTFGHVETQFALGMQGINVTPGESNIEFGAVPTAALRVAYRLNPESWFGISGIATALRFTNPPVPTATAEEERRAAWGANVFADITSGKVNFRAKAYIAQNTANMGMLTLAGGRFGQSVREAGGFVSVKANMKPHAVYVMAGAAAVLDPSVMAAGYTPAVAATPTSPAVPAARGGLANPGIEWNANLRVGYAVTPMKGFTLAVEPYLIRTRFRLDAASTLEPNRTAYGVEVGGLYAF